MEEHMFGRTDMHISKLGFGGVEINSISDESPAYLNFEETSFLLNKALDSGLNVIDTAECYGNSEELIGKAIGQRRAEYYLFTKCGHASGFDLPDWDRKLLALSIDRSLQRLQTNYIDVLFLHTCSEEILRRGEVIEVLQNAQKAGKIRYIGYSGDSVAALFAIESGMFDALETSVNILDQEAIELTLPRAKQQGLGVVAKRPIANAIWKTGSKPTSPYLHSYWNRLQQLNYTYFHDDTVDPFEVALRFTLSIPEIDTMIVGTSRLAHWYQNLHALEKGPLPKDLFEMIRSRWKLIAQETRWAGER
jgi:aryl-alcohol dehydrogenase-like predicted oxidoreductase